MKIKARIEKSLLPFLCYNRDKNVDERGQEKEWNSRHLRGINPISKYGLLRNSGSP
jgi:triosephosphate isomerase